MMTVKELVRLTGMTQKQYAEYFGIPFRTVQNWITGQEKCKEGFWGIAADPLAAGMSPIYLYRSISP